MKEMAQPVPTTILLDKETQQTLREVGRQESRSVGFLIRRAVNLWLADHGSVKVETWPRKN